MRIENVYYWFKSKIIYLNNSLSKKDKIKTKKFENSLVVVLNQYKRNNLEKQLRAINNQSIMVDKIIVFQNENHHNIELLKKKYDFEHIKSSLNLKYFGRFAVCLSFSYDYYIIIDDDVIPGPECFETYLNECIRLNSIIGGNGRIAEINPFKKKLYHPNDNGIREKSILVDFVGHIWVFKRQWLFDMFSIMPYTLETGEDMHFCFSAKLKSNIKSYVCRQNSNNQLYDLYDGSLGIDKNSSFWEDNYKLRKNIEEYFLSLGINFIKDN